MTNIEILQLADECGVIAVQKHEWDGKRFNHTDDYLDGDAAALVIFAKMVAVKKCEELVWLLRNLSDDHTPTDCAEMICALEALGEIQAGGEE